MLRFPDTMPVTSEAPTFEARTNPVTNALVVLLVIGLAVAGVVRHLQREHAEVERTERLIQLQNALLQLNQSHNDLMRYLFGASPEALKALPVHEGSAISELEKLATSAKSNEQREVIQQVIKRQKEYREMFAAPLIEGRKTLDAGNSTLPNLQITYLQLDPDRWYREFDNLCSMATREFRQPRTE